MWMCLCDRLAKGSATLVTFVKLTQTEVSWEDGASDWPVDMSTGHVFDS